MHSTTSWRSMPNLDALSMSATLPHAQTRMTLSTKFKKSSSEPLMAHQAALPQRHTPHPNETVQTRWPVAGWKQGGVIDHRDMRRHAMDFGYRELRFKQVSVEPKEVPELTLDELRTYLVKRAGSLQMAFADMSFFKDGKLSAIEWQEGVYNLLGPTFGTESHKFRMSMVPRLHFNARMQHLFALIDANCDGLINFDEFSRPYLEPEEGSHSFTRRRKAERSAHNEEKMAALQRMMLTANPATRKLGPPDHHQDPETLTNLRDFAVYIMKSFKDVNKAFAAFDAEGNGQVNLAEFTEGARKIRYFGDTSDIFKLLDQKDTGTIRKECLLHLRQLPAFTSPVDEGTQERALDLTLGTSKKDATIAKKLRSPIQTPPSHHGGLTLTSSDIMRPMGQGMRTASGFYTFPRSTTGRSDQLLHPNELPGQDGEQFSMEHGPGYLEKGPEYFPFLGLTEHPRRGDKWKIGANVDRTKRFGPMIASKQAAADRDLSGMGYATYEGRRPQDGFKICGTGGLAWAKGPVRPGITFR